MKAFIKIIDRELKKLSIEELISLERDTISGLSVKYKDSWKRIDNYIYTENNLYLSWRHITPNDWKSAKFLYQEDNKLYFDWDDFVFQNYFNHLYNDMLKVSELVNKDNLWVTNSELNKLIEKLSSLK